MLTKEQLKSLRGQIVLNSLYTSHYENNMGIEPRAVQDFFDGYCDYLLETIKDNGGERMTSAQQSREFRKLDNEETLWEWYNCFDEDPLRALPSFEVFKPTFEGSTFFNELYAHLGEPISKHPLNEEYIRDMEHVYTDEELYNWLFVYDIEVLFSYTKACNLVDKEN